MDDLDMLRARTLRREDGLGVRLLDPIVSRTPLLWVRERQYAREPPPRHGRSPMFPTCSAIRLLGDQPGHGPKVSICILIYLDSYITSVVYLFYDDDLRSIG